MNKKVNTKMPLTSADVKSERLEWLLKLFPEAFTEGMIDLERLKQALGDDVNEGSERYGLSWAGKADAIRAIQVPSIGTLVPCPEESVDFEATENLFIEGDNLEVLKLLQKSYHGKVKMIYIDPPYNTGNEFIYPDNFRDGLQEYLRFTGQVDEEGGKLSTNRETSGRYHSNWLSMMYPRLFLARNLISDDGLIFISIDDHELANLKHMMDEIFGEECFKNCIIFRRGIKSVQAQFDTVDSLTIGHEYILMYAKNPDTRFSHLRIELDEPRVGSWNNHWRGTDRPTMRYELFGIIPENGQWRWSKSRSIEAIKNYQRMLSELNVKSEDISQNQIDDWYYEATKQSGVDIDLLRLSKSNKPEHYVPPTNTKLGSDLWVDISPRGSAELKSLFGTIIFDNPKPVGLIRRMLEFSTISHSGDIVLDFFAGSSTTAQAVLELNIQDAGNRKYIMVQLPEQTKENSIAFKAGYRTISDIGKERIRRVIKQLKDDREGELDLTGREKPLDLGFKVFKLASSNFKIWDAEDSPKDEEGLAKQLKLYADHVLPGRSRVDILFELLLKRGVPLTARIEERKIEGKTVYSIEDGTLLICLEERVTVKALRGMMDLKPQQIICLDNAFGGNDQLKTNTVLESRDREIEFRTV